MALFVIGEGCAAIEETTLIKSLNVSFCLNSLERSQETIIQQLATLLTEHKLHREQLEIFKKICK